MDEKYFTVEEIATLLNMHAKTIQRYIREGKLRASKVGKSWRVTGHDLSVFAEGEDNRPDSPEGDGLDGKSADGRIRISSVIDIDVDRKDSAMRIVNTITAALNAKPPEYGNSTMSAQFIEAEMKVRIMLWGDLRVTRSILDFLSELTDQQ